MVNFGVKRKIIQTAATLLMNGNFAGFLSGRIYRGPLKQVCVPGLNCYSCPGALGACPIGSLQALAGNPQTLVSFYVYGFLLIVGVSVGRLACGFLCPFGLVQELLHKIPLKKWRRKRCFRLLSKLKYVVLAVLVIGIPTGLTLAGAISSPAFCKYVCPAGTLGGGIPLALANASIRASLGWLFVWKMAVLLSILLLSIKIYRPFCRFLCPLGAVYSLFNRVSILHIRTEKANCNDCGACHAVCKTEAPFPESPECIRCGDCVQGCPRQALRWGIRGAKEKTCTNAIKEREMLR